jgi:drug/metabolite transporter (DMT)-like permease
MAKTTEVSKQISKGRMLWYFTLLAIANLIWATQPTAVKILNRQMGPIAMTFLPFYITTVAFLPLLLRERRTNPGAMPTTWSDCGRFVLAGVGGQVICQLGITWGIARSLASNGAILELMLPVMTAFLASFMLHEKLTPLRVASLLIGLVGVMVMSLEDLRLASFMEMKHIVGNAMIVVGCLAGSFYNTYCKGLLRRFQEIEILIFSYIAASVVTMPLLVWVEPFHWKVFSALDWKSWVAFAFLAILHYGTSMLLFFAALKHVDVTVASFSLYLIPIFGVPLAVVILGERLSVLAVVGSAIVCVAAVLIMKYETIY